MMLSRHQNPIVLRPQEGLLEWVECPEWICNFHILFSYFFSNSIPQVARHILIIQVCIDVMSLTVLNHNDSIGQTLVESEAENPLSTIGSKTNWTYVAGLSWIFLDDEFEL